MGLAGRQGREAQDGALGRFHDDRVTTGSLALALRRLESVDAIIHDKPYSEVKRGVEASLTASMGRMAAHTGQEITFEQMLNSDHEFAPGLDKLTRETPAPLQPDAKGRYPVPQPGIITKREY